MDLESALLSLLSGEVKRELPQRFQQTGLNRFIHDHLYLHASPPSAEFLQTLVISSTIKRPIRL